MSSVRKRYCVFGCQALSTLGIPVHKFPNPEKDPDLFDQWLSAVGYFLKESNRQKIYAGKSVCDYHFLDCQKIYGNRIIPSAVPCHQLFCVPQSLTTFVLTDHSYCRPKRVASPMADLTNISDNAIDGHSVMASTSSACSAGHQLAVHTTVDKFEAGPLHRFPSPFYPSTERFLQWKEILDPVIQSKGDNYIYNCVRFCDSHFIEVYHSKKSKNLTRNAIPTINHNRTVPTYVCGNQSNDEAENKEAQESKNRAPPSPNQGPSTAKRKCSGLQGNDDNYTNLDEDDYDNTIVIGEEEVVNAFDDDVQFVNETPLAQEQQAHTDFRCNICHGDIIGFRYTCVQCADWDMCAACEARGEHPAHYVLRLPAPKPYGDHAPVIIAIRDHIQEMLENDIHEVYCKEEAVDEEMYKEMSPEAVDPISVINDRSVPQLNLGSSTAEEESTDTAQELLTQECVLKKYLMNPDPIQDIKTLNESSSHSVHTDDEETEDINEFLKEIPISEAAVPSAHRKIDSTFSKPIPKALKVIKHVSESAHATTPKVIDSTFSKSTVMSIPKMLKVIKPISESTVTNTPRIVDSNFSISTVTSVPRVMKVIAPVSEATVSTTPKIIDSTLNKTGLVKNLVKVPLSAANICPAKVIYNKKPGPKRKIIVVKKSDVNVLFR